MVCDTVEMADRMTQGETFCPELNGPDINAKDEPDDTAFWTPEVRALLWNIMVLPYVSPEKTRGGIVLPAQVAETNDYLCGVGMVVSLGSLCFTGSKFDQLQGEVPVKLGDFVMFNAHHGIWVKGQDPQTGKTIKLKMIHDDAVIAVVDDPDQIVSYVK